ncbi:MAG: hypothetical protein KDC75_03810, partial [Phaeodactylibacter sp.]|nr:hypothetical protein [Phaeodactylibacter sp.]
NFNALCMNYCLVVSSQAALKLRLIIIIVFLEKRVFLQDQGSVNRSGKPKDILYPKNNGYATDQLLFERSGVDGFATFLFFWH